MKARMLSLHPSTLEQPADRAAAADAARLREEWTRHLAQYEWDHYCTLTSEPTVADRLRREFVNGFVRRLARATQGPVPWFYTLERGAAGTAHMHALIAGTHRLTLEQVQRAWRLGFAQVRRYDPARGAAYYLTKRLDTAAADYDVSSRLPRLSTRNAA